MKKFLKELFSDFGLAITIIVLIVIGVGIGVGIGMYTYNDIIKVKFKNDNLKGSVSQKPITVFGGLLNLEQFPNTSSTSTPLYVSTSTEANALVSTIEYGGFTDNISLMFYLQASSSPVTIPWFYQFSNDEGCSSSTDPLIAWYSYDPITPTSSINVYNSSSSLELWPITNTTKNTKIVDLSIPPSKCIKVSLDRTIETDIESRNYTVDFKAILKDAD